MRVIVEVLGRAFVFQFIQGKVTAQDDEDTPGHDPHSVNGGQFEHGAGADSYTSDVVAERKFGFHGG